ncbi:MAG: TolC family protein, partial [Candidatus Acidiferrum sp.]
MRWKSLCGKLALLLAGVCGCSRPCYLSCEDYVASNTMAASGLSELDPKLSTKSTLDACAAPQTVIDPERPIRYLSLAEAIAIALEQGTTGNQTAALSNLAGGNAAGIQTSSDQLVSFNGRSIGASDSIRVLALDPASVGVGIEQSLSKFDAQWVTSTSWQNTDRPVGTAIDQFQTGNAVTNDIRQLDANVSTGIIKPLPTGGVAGITFSNSYSLTNLAAPVNPAYKPDLQFAFEQPLLQGYGTEINELRAAHPGSQLLNLLPGVANAASPTAEGILITRIRYDQSRAEFQRNVHSMLVNVEIGYWNLYNTYWQLYSQEQGMRQAYEAWKIKGAQFAAGRGTTAELAQARGQYELFRGQRMSALGDLQ